METTTIKFQGVEAGDFKVDAAEIVVPNENVKPAEALVQNLYDAAEVIDALHADKATLEGERDTLLKQVEDSKEMSPKELHAKTEARRQIMNVAQHVGFKEDDLSDDFNEAIMAKVVRKDNADTPTNASGDYINGCFSMIQARMAREDGAKVKQAKLGEVTKPQVDKKDVAGAGDGEEKTYRQAAIDKMQGAHNKTDDQLRADGFAN